ncbi:hypothetical protein [Arthrobacter globiformis]|uniref:hypothetical protein n=1 Tax=Arthrobacter globiformis TaxID=1665 RepID=UPI0027D8B711|nr:hypothetical protein [Arthrobacter globiformis]
MVVNIRGRVLLSRIGVLLSAALVTVWASGTKMGLVGGPMLNIATVDWVLVSADIVHLLRTNDRKLTQYRSDARAAADWHAAEQALNVARTQWLEHVRKVAGPALARISDPAHTITEDEHREL